MTAISRSAFEVLRKPASIVLAMTWLAVAVMVTPLHFDQGFGMIMELTGYLCLIVAALGRLWSYAFIGGRKNQDLCRDGPYSLSRNPLYLFSFLGVIGAGMALQSVALMGVGAGVFLTYYHFVIRTEERRLLQLFGDSFALYCREVPRFWPCRWQVSQPESITLPSHLFTRTLTEVFWFLAFIVVIETIEHGKLAHWWPTIQIQLW